MSLDVFNAQLKGIPQGAGDFNFICAVTYAEYNALLMTARGLMVPLEFLHSNIQKGLDLLDNATFNNLKKGLDDLNGTMKQVLKNPVKDLKNISKQIGDVGNALSHTCEFFLSNLPSELFKMFQDLQYGIADIANGLMRIPDALTSNIMDSIMKFKMDALTAVLGGLFNTILSPFLAYETFLSQMGIKTLIKKLHEMEICMMRKGPCQRNPKDFQEPETHKPWSVYLKDQFMINAKGQLNFNSLTSNGTTAGRARIVHQNFMSFMSY